MSRSFDIVQYIIVLIRFKVGGSVGQSGSGRLIGTTTTTTQQLLDLVSGGGARSEFKQPHPPPPATDQDVDRRNVI